MEQEQWKPIKGYEGKYDVSNFGRVRSYYKGLHIKTQRINNCGYCYVKLYVRGKRQKMARVNRLVAEAFIPNPDNMSDVNHKDMNKLNNHVSNLEWTSHADNVKHSYDSGKRHAHRWTDEEKLMISRNTRAYLARRKATT
jgi:hypothetical protein